MGKGVASTWRRTKNAAELEDRKSCRGGGRKGSCTKVKDKRPRQRVKGLFLVVVINNSKEPRYPLGCTGLLGRLQPK